MASASPTPLTLVLDRERFPRRVFLALVGIELTLVALDATINWGRLIDIRSIRHLVNVAREDSLSDWYSSTQTFFVGIVLSLIALEARASDAPRMVARGWTAVAGFFLYMGIDDGAAIHERVGSAVKYLYGSSRVVSHYPSYTWQLALGPFFALMGLMMFVLVWREIRTPQLRGIFLAALLCYIAKVGIDFIEGLTGSEAVIASALGHPKWARDVGHFQKVIEELIKMLGSSLFMLTFLKHLINLRPAIEVRFEPTPTASR